jgi:putative spermidine/putrescine transport system ATP-binding protein
MKVKAVHGDTVAVDGSGMTLEGTPVGRLSAGDDVVAGIRPEDLRLGAHGVPVTVEVVEYQGRELAVEARTADGVAVHLTASERPSPGDRVTVSVTPSRVLVFPAAAP